MNQSWQPVVAGLCLFALFSIIKWAVKKEYHGVQRRAFQYALAKMKEGKYVRGYHVKKDENTQLTLISYRLLGQIILTAAFKEGGTPKLVEFDVPIKRVFGEKEDVQWGQNVTDVLSYMRTDVVPPFVEKNREQKQIEKKKDHFRKLIIDTVNEEQPSK